MLILIKLLHALNHYGLLYHYALYSSNDCNQGNHLPIIELFNYSENKLEAPGEARFVAT